MIEEQAEKLLDQMTMKEIREAAKVGIMFSLITMGRAVKTVKKLLTNEKEKDTINATK